VWRGATDASGITGIYCSVINESTGAVVVNNLTVQANTTAIAPRVCVVNGRFLFVWFSSSDSKLYAASMTVGGTTLTTTATDTTANVGTPYNYEIAATSDASGALVVFESATAGNAVSCIVIGETVTVTRAEVQLMASATVTNKSPLALVAFTANVFLVACGSSAAATLWTATFTCAADGLITGLTASSPVTPGGVVLTMTGVATSATSVRMFSLGINSPSAVRPNSTFTVSSTNTASAVTTIFNSIVYSGANYGPWQAGKAFVYDGAAYLPVFIATTLQPTLFVLDASGAVVASRVATAAVPSRMPSSGIFG